MGGSQSQISNIGLFKGEGLRILRVKPNSPLEGVVEPYFDFIIDLVSAEPPERTPREILDKLTGENKEGERRKPRSFVSLVKENKDKNVTLKIVSTKYRNPRNVDVLLNDQWGTEGDILGIDIRRERFDEVFDTYFPFTEINLNSPIKKGGIVEGQFLIACEEFKYCSMNEFIENLYDRFYDKQINEKNVHLVVFNLPRNQLRSCEVVLSRSWGGKGLLGCEFVEGHLNRFPKNFEEYRNQILRREKNVEQGRRIKSDLIESNRTSESLVEILKKNRTKRSKHLKNLKNIIVAERPPPPMKQTTVLVAEGEGEGVKEEIVEDREGGWEKNEKRIRELEERLKSVENTLLKITEYIDSIDQDEIEEINDH